MTVAETILQQLGGRRFTTMTGAKNYTGYQDGLAFRLPSNFASDGINYIKITLTQMDTYDIVFSKIRGLKYAVLETIEGAYNEDLRRVISDRTGLSLTL
jgi:hypothetical protein